jgi:hypothetical protein
MRLIRQPKWPTPKASYALDDIGAMLARLEEKEKQSRHVKPMRSLARDMQRFLDKMQAEKANLDPRDVIR